MKLSFYMALLASFFGAWLIPVEKPNANRSDWRGPVVLNLRPPSASGVEYQRVYAEAWSRSFIPPVAGPSVMELPGPTGLSEVPIRSSEDPTAALLEGERKLHSLLNKDVSRMGAMGIGMHPPVRRAEQAATASRVPNSGYNSAMF
jgi:hypothetical protein